MSRPRRAGTPSSAAGVEERTLSHHGLTGFGLRTFGSCAADMDIDFGRSPRPVLVTNLLKACACFDKGGVGLKDLLRRSASSGA